MIDSSGQLTSVHSVSPTEGAPPPSAVLAFDAPASSAIEQWAVAYPIDDEFVYDPLEFGPAVSIDMQLDVSPNAIGGTSHVNITLALIQDEPFIITPTAESPIVDATTSPWSTLSQTGLQASDFEAVDGGPEIPDFGRPFQFGYLFSGDYSTSGLTVELGIDNMEATVNTIPEPSSITLALAMGTAVLWHRIWVRDDES